MRAPRLDRIDFRPDQSLDAGDLAQASRRTQQLLELHTARGHDVWGVATGYLCSLDAATGVAVGPGVALDAYGHQLINSANRVVPLPAVPVASVPQVFDLVASYDTTGALRAASPSSSGSSSGTGFGSALAEQPALRWVWAGAQPLLGTVRPSDSIRLGADVPIARLTTASNTRPAAVDTTQRTVAHALIRPKLASGRVLQSSVPVSGSYASWTMTVSTADAGFVSDSPAYFVSLDAHPFGDTADLGQGASDGSSLPNLDARMARWLGPYVSIEAKSRDSFTLRVSTGARGDGGPSRQAGPTANPVPVSWLGVETPNQPFAVTIGWALFLSTWQTLAIGAP